MPPRPCTACRNGGGIEDDLSGVNLYQIMGRYTYIETSLGLYPELCLLFSSLPFPAQKFQHTIRKEEKSERRKNRRKRKVRKKRKNNLKEKKRKSERKEKKIRKKRKKTKKGKKIRKKRKIRKRKIRKKGSYSPTAGLRRPASHPRNSLG